MLISAGTLQQRCAGSWRTGLKGLMPLYLGASLPATFECCRCFFELAGSEGMRAALCRELAFPWL